MKAIRMTTDRNKICFQNFERIDESEIFQEAGDKLKKSGALLSEVKELPFSDEINGELDGVSFNLLLDLNYGAELRCTDEKITEKLIQILNN